ncbi:MAG: YccF domain-containing protein [Bacteroidaceae bacterium]|nr:YccF domain-containing protein [Bacteroidaceae bacterium]
MQTFGNIIWFIFGGVLIALEYFVGGFLLCLTIIGIPFGIQVFKLGVLALWPMGHSVISEDYSGGCLSLIMNILWILVGGIWISLSHLLLGVLFCITLIGIPFGIQHFKLAGLALTPFGKTIE